MDAKHLIAVERWTWMLAAVVIAAGFIAVSARTAVGVTAGALLMSVNAWTLRKIAQRSQTMAKPGAAVLLFNLKMAALIALVFVVIRYLPIDPIGFVVGISIFPAAILAAAIRHALRTSEDHKGETQNG
jgi:hypothetical protein